MNIYPGQIYRHFKGNKYEVICVARHTESEEELVVYRSVNNPNAIYARPLMMFTSKVDIDKYPDAGQEYRFQIADGTGDLNEADGETASVEKPESENTAVKENPKPAEESTSGIDPKVMAFLDTDDFEQKLNILSEMNGRVTEAMLNTMAFSVDFEFNEGSIDEKYNELLNCISLRAKFECSRLR
ncbi:MAG: DUF1653 domain-containing protein [Lachnospiraceae bacterium]|nr:DUF1653 domain-containing protein [Lachnospiraceae bacterium]